MGIDCSRLGCHPTNPIVTHEYRHALRVYFRLTHPESIVVFNTVLVTGEVPSELFTFHTAIPLLRGQASVILFSTGSFEKWRRPLIYDISHSIIFSPVLNIVGTVLGQTGLSLFLAA